MIIKKTNEVNEESEFLFDFGTDSKLLVKKMLDKIFQNDLLDLSFEPVESDLIKVYLDLERLSLLFKHPKGLFICCLYNRIPCRIMY